MSAGYQPDAQTRIPLPPPSSKTGHTKIKRGFYVKGLRLRCPDCGRFLRLYLESAVSPTLVKWEAICPFPDCGGHYMGSLSADARRRDSVNPRPGLVLPLRPPRQLRQLEIGGDDE